MRKVNLDNYNLKFFLNDLDELHITLSEKQLCQFIIYYELLTEWNRVMNLTAITDFNDVCKKHFIDSLSLVKANDIFTLENNLSVIDVGTGAGFPGIPLKIAFPNLKITLLDSLQKRINFLQTVIDELSLDMMETVHGRAEDFAKKGKLREKFDISVSRAVANLATLSEYCIPYVKKGGYFVSYKSEKIMEEIEKAEKAVSVLGGSIKKQVEFNIPSSDIYRNLVVISKVKETPALYPRKAGVPSKNPIENENIM